MAIMHDAHTSAVYTAQDSVQDAGRFERITQALGAVCGIIWPFLGIYAFMGLVVGSGFWPDTNAPLPELARHLAAHPVTPDIWLASNIELFSLALFVVFIAYLWGVLRQAEGDPGWLSMLACAGGLLSVALKIASFPFTEAILMRADIGRDPQLARVLFDMGDAAFVHHLAALGLMLVPSALIIIRTGVLPRWTGVLAAVVGTTLLATEALPDLLNIGQLGFIVWIVPTGTIMLWRAVKPRPVRM